MSETNAKENEINEEISNLVEIKENENIQNDKVEFMQLWKISDFTEELNKVFKQKHNTELNITINTLNNYFRDLEDAGIHYLNRTNGTKVYDPMDMNIAEFIAWKRSKKLQKGATWQLAQIFDAIKRDMPCRKMPEEASNVNKGLSEQLQEFQTKMTETLRAEFNFQEKLIELKNDTSKQMNRSMLDVLRKQKEFKELAWVEWDKKPESERMEGFIFKREKAKAREMFIDDWVEKKMMEWLIEQRDS